MAAKVVSSGTMKMGQVLSGTVTGIPAGTTKMTMEIASGGEGFLVTPLTQSISGSTINWSFTLPIREDVLYLVYPPEATSVVVSLVVKLYKGSTLTTHVPYLSKTMHIPDTWYPKHTFNLALTGANTSAINSKFGTGYIVGLEGLANNLTFTNEQRTSINPTYYSNTYTYKSRKTQISKITADGKINITTNDFASLAPHKDANSFELTRTYTDHRGRVATYSQSVDVKKFIHPQVTETIGVQCDPNGNPNPNGTHLKVTASGRLAYIEGLSAHQRLGTVKVYWREPGQSNWNNNPITMTVPGTTNEFENITAIIPNVPTDESWDIKVVSAWTFSEVGVTYEDFKQWSSGQICISRLAGGKGVTLFKEATKEGFFVGDVDYTITTPDMDTISANLGGVPDMSLAEALKKMTEAVDVTLTWKSGWGGTYMCKAYPAQRICRLTGTVATGHPVLEPSTYVTVADIPSAYLPQEVYTLTASGGTQIVEGTVSSLGVRLRAKIGKWTAGYLGYFSGWWYY